MWVLVVSRDGRALLSHVLFRSGITALAPGETHERNLSWFDFSRLTSLSHDGRLMFLNSDDAVGWSEDGQTIWALAGRRLPARIVRIDLATGKRTPWREIVDADPAGLNPTFMRLYVSDDGKSYASGYARTLSDLYLVAGLK
jgi:hypothetical protein